VEKNSRGGGFYNSSFLTHAQTNALRKTLNVRYKPTAEYLEEIEMRTKISTISIKGKDYSDTIETKNISHIEIVDNCLFIETLYGEYFLSVGLDKEKSDNG